MIKRWDIWVDDNAEEFMDSLPIDIDISLAYTPAFNGYWVKAQDVKDLLKLVQKYASQDASYELERLAMNLLENWDD